MQAHRSPFVVGVSLVLAACCFGCSGDEGEGGSGGAAGTASSGAGSGGGATAGAAAGGAGSGLGGSSGAATGGSSSAGNAGSAGSAAVETVYNPALPKPSHDCLADLSGQCLAISGTLLGVALDKFCAREGATSAFFPDPDGWPMPCQEGVTAFDGLFYQIEVPAQGPGPFHHVLKNPDEFAAADVMVMQDDVGGSGQSKHLKELEMAGTVAKDTASGGNLMSGTFRATWSMPDALCGSDCGVADVHGSFRVINTWQPE